MVMRWDAATGRYVNTAPTVKQGVDTLPKGVSPYSYGAHYVDAVTGEDKIIVAGSKPDKVVVKDPKTGAWVNKGTANAAGSAYAPNSSKTTGGTNTGAPTTGRGSGTTMAPPTTLAPKPSNPPSTTGAPSTTVAPSTTGVTPTTVAAKQKTQNTLPPVNNAWTDNGWQNTPVGQVYVDTKTGETKRRNPKGQADTVLLSKEETAKNNPTNTNANETSSTSNAVLDSWLKTTFPENTPEQNAAVATLFNSGGSSSGGGGSSGPSTASKKASAKIQTQAGKKAQAQYNALAKTAFDQAQADAGAFYNKQTEQANKSIDSATADYLKNLIAPAAYSNVPIAQLTPEQQALSQNLQAYGATENKANEQMTQDTGYNQWLANFAKQGTQQMQQADMGYFDALKNAGIGGQAAARLGVAQNVANLQGQSTASAEAIRRQLIQAGIDALIAGQTNAANTLAQ